MVSLVSSGGIVVGHDHVRSYRKGDLDLFLFINKFVKVLLDSCRSHPSGHCIVHHVGSSRRARLSENVEDSRVRDDTDEHRVEVSTEGDDEVSHTLRLEPTLRVGAYFAAATPELDTSLL